MSKELESDAGAQGSRGHQIERTMAVVERRLEAEGEEDDAGNQAQEERIH